MSTESMPLFTQGRALVVGVGTYADPRWNAPTAERDAAGLAELLADPQVGAYAAGNVELLSKNVTAAEVGRALRRLADRSAADSTVLIAFTGHGALDEDNLYCLATQETEFRGERIRPGTGFSIRQLSDALKAIPAQKLLLLINACFAGHARALATQGGLRPDLVDAPHGAVVPDAAGNQLLASGQGRAMITASRPGQRSYFQRDDTHSYFGQALLDGLRGSGIGGASGYVGLFELYDLIYRQVRRVTSRLGYEQEPVLHLVEGIGPFPVARYPLAEADDPDLLQRRPARGTAVREVSRTEIQQTVAAGGVGVIAGQGATVTIDNSFSVIRAGDHVQIGDVQIGDVARESVNKAEVIYGAAPADEERGKSPLNRLPWVANRMEDAINVDEGARADAAHEIRQGHRAYTQGDRARARERLERALGLMRPMGNSYVDSLVKKVEAALREL